MPFQLRQDQLISFLFSVGFNQQAKQIFLYTVSLFGHSLIFILSAYWLRVLCRGGMKNMLHFKPSKHKKEGKRSAFRFGTDMGRSEAKQKVAIDKAPASSQAEQTHEKKE